MNNKKRAAASPSIITNKKAFHDYFIEERFEAGIALTGWEVKALRAGRIQVKESYVILKNGEAFLFGAFVNPLSSASTHVLADPSRTRKLLLHRRELAHLIGAVERQGFALVPLSLYWKKGRVKAEIAIARGKKEYDKRESDKKRDWQRERARIMKARA